MDITVVSLVLLVVMLVLLTTGVWVALSLLGVGLLGMLVFTAAPAGKVMATTIWGSSGNWALTALPLFIWMAEILFRTRLSDDIFSGLAPWLTRIPGRLMHVNVLGCGIFAAVSGSTSATCATIAKISLPELKRRGYDERMIIGSLAASGTLGILIPPSIMMIVYGFIAEVSIARLFIAGVIPGILMVVLFMGYVVAWAWRYPDKTPPSDIRMTHAERLYASRRLIPVVSLIALVIGSIYSGTVTPTEAATVGVVGALLLSLLYRSLTWSNFVDSLVGATRTSCMIAFILAGAAFMSMAMGYTGIPRVLAQWIASFQLSAWGLLGALTVVYVVLGFALDGISMVVLTSAVVQPMIRQAGIDPVWFGIYIVLMVQVAELTPPVGFPMFVMQMYTGRSLLYVSRAALPFFFLLLVGTALIAMFPDLVTYLPNKMLNR
ncbi:MAG: C4-dicarboxylate ABC transporter permease [Candidatus Rokuibacteriota bacterium]|nr:MAG: C4-dicarboxylate ABC transporter permease [Candidatus Rokubacteria bacterium]